MGGYPSQRGFPAQKTKRAKATAGQTPTALIPSWAGLMEVRRQHPERLQSTTVQLQRQRALLIRHVLARRICKDQGLSQDERYQGRACLNHVAQCLSPCWDLMEFGGLHIEAENAAKKKEKDSEIVHIRCKSLLSHKEISRHSERYWWTSLSISRSCMNPLSRLSKSMAVAVGKHAHRSEQERAG